MVPPDQRTLLQKSTTFRLLFGDTLTTLHLVFDFESTQAVIVDSSVKSKPQSLDSARSRP